MYDAGSQRADQDDDDDEADDNFLQQRLKQSPTPTTTSYFECDKCIHPNKHARNRHSIEHDQTMGDIGLMHYIPRCSFMIPHLICLILAELLYI